MSPTNHLCKEGYEDMHKAIALIFIVASLGMSQVVQPGGGGGGGTTPGSVSTPASYTFSVSGGVVYAHNNVTGAVDASGSDACVVVNGILATAAAVGGRLYFKDGIYPCNTLTQETKSGWTTYYYGIGIPSSGISQWVQWQFEGEARSPFNWGIDQYQSDTIQTNGVIFLMSASALAGVASSNMVSGIFQRPDPTNTYSNELFFKNITMRLPSQAEYRGNVTGIAAWVASTVSYENVIADFNDSYKSIAQNASAPAAGTLGSFGLTSTYGTQGLPQIFKGDYVIGFNIGYDWWEHIVSTADDAAFTNHPFEIGRTGPNAPNAAAVFHNAVITKFVDQENAGGPILGPTMQLGSRVDLIGYDIELGQAATPFWFQNRTTANFVETNPSNSFGSISYTAVQANIGNVNLDPLFTSGGQRFAISGNLIPSTTLNGTPAAGASLCVGSGPAGTIVGCSNSLITGANAWKATEGTGTLALDYVTGNNIVLSNTSWSGAISPLTQALTFNGTTASGRATTDLGLLRTNPFTIIAWVNLSAAATAYPILTSFGASFHGWAFGLQEHSDSIMHLNLYLGGITGSQALNTFSANACFVPVTSTTHQVAVTYDGSSLAAGVVFYLDGVACTSNLVTTNTLASAITSPGPTVLGGQCLVGTACNPTGPGGASFFSGKMGNVQYFPSVLIASNISYLNTNPYNYNSIYGSVAGLGAASAAFGQTKVVGDSTTVSAEGQTCTGGSNVVALAFSNGTVWKCF